MAKVLVAMSGGVDSSITAVLLKEQGYEVIGVTFIFYDNEGINASETSDLIRKNVNLIGIQHYFVDLRESFDEKVVKPFYNAYKSGITPNPCVICNRIMKFHHLLIEANRIGADFISTGHYATIKDGILCKGIDNQKDQSYVLYRLTHEQLQRTILPLSIFKKKEVQQIALSLGLPCAEKRESQEVCFLNGSGYHTFMKDYKDGDIIHIETGKKMGTHKGFFRYTIGQRKRIQVPSQVPLYVVDIDVLNNIIYVGDAKYATSEEIKVSDINWIIPKKEDFDATVKIRSTMKDQPARIAFISEQEVIVRFKEPQWAPACGQSAVFYEDNKVIGGGIIHR